MTFKGAIAEAESASGPLAATTHALHWQSHGYWHELPWHEILRATWNSESTLFVVDPISGDRLEWSLTQPGRLPEAARERITSTIVAQELFNLPGHGQVTLIFRNVNGEILVQTLPPVESPLVRQRIAQVKGELGIG